MQEAINKYQQQYDLTKSIITDIVTTVSVGDFNNQSKSKFIYLRDDMEYYKYDIEIMGQKMQMLNRGDKAYMKREDGTWGEIHNNKSGGAMSNPLGGMLEILNNGEMTYIGDEDGLRKYKGTAKIAHSNQEITLMFDPQLKLPVKNRMTIMGNDVETDISYKEISGVIFPNKLELKMTGDVETVTTIEYTNIVINQSVAKFLFNLE